LLLRLLRLVGQIRGALSDGFRLAKLDAVGVVHAAVADGVGQRRVTDDGVPVLRLELAGDDGRARVVAVIEQLKQVLAVLRGEGFEVELETQDTPDTWVTDARTGA
jgi:hypothetical protein